MIAGACAVLKSVVRSEATVDVKLLVEMSTNANKPENMERTMSTGMTVSVNSGMSISSTARESVVKDVSAKSGAPANNSTAGSMGMSGNGNGDIREGV